MDLVAIILAGGRGLRMSSGLPKPLISVNGLPLIFHQIDYLKNKVNQIVLSLGYQGEIVKERVKRHYFSLDTKISYILEKSPLGTAGGLKRSLAKVRSERVLVLNTDDLADINIDELKKIKKNTICVAHPKLPFGLVKEKQGRAFFIEKPKLSSWVNCGWYLFKKKSLIPLLPNKGSLEYDILPKLKLKIFKHSGYWYPINSSKDIIEFEENF